MSKFTLQINDKTHEVSCPANKPLLWILREDLGLTGTKYGCGVGACGACTVHVDGMATRSCLTRAKAVEGKAITTIEGLASDADQAVIQAWTDEQVPQCGYCQAGQIMSATALLAKREPVTDDSIAEAMEGNLCRCGTYMRIRRAIKRAAKTIEGESK